MADDIDDYKKKDLKLSPLSEPSKDNNINNLNNEKEVFENLSGRIKSERKSNNFINYFSNEIFSQNNKNENRNDIPLARVMKIIDDTYSKTPFMSKEKLKVNVNISNNYYTTNINNKIYEKNDKKERALNYDFNNMNEIISTEPNINKVNNLEIYPEYMDFDIKIETETDSPLNSKKLSQLHYKPIIEQQSEDQKRLQESLEILTTRMKTQRKENRDTDRKEKNNCVEIKEEIEIEGKFKKFNYLESNKIYKKKDKRILLKDNTKEEENIDKSKFPATVSIKRINNISPRTLNNKKTKPKPISRHKKVKSFLYIPCINCNTLIQVDDVGIIYYNI